ncbi:hypothetical protein HDU87_001217 [Geranomyces variabilis]|uniref:Uncharacterized protein n=1 Tax=Geranomyces variabilis TaxID=109894 RepID=A0AAD5TBC4_9FUNG|nr:hypothetical protein HDU87_001217 [Geranomyces variabilis]
MDEVFDGTLILLVGKDATLEDYDPDITTARFLLRIWSLGALRLDLLPFVNLYPWLIQGRMVLAMDFLSQYMSIMRPWITVTFSKHVFQVISHGFAPFGDLSGPSSLTFDMELIYDETSDAAADSAYTVQIPPRKRQETYAILLDLGAKVANLQTPRKDTYERIVAAAADRVRDNGFTEIFEAAKAQLQTYLAHTKLEEVHRAKRRSRKLHCTAHHPGALSARDSQCLSH